MPMLGVKKNCKPEANAIIVLDQPRGVFIYLILTCDCPNKV